MDDPLPVDFKAMQHKWQAHWKEHRTFDANVAPKRPKFFVTFPYPYVNGTPHVGHSYSCFRADAYARFKRLQGYNVLFPQGFHATGEPILGAVERLRNGDAAQLQSFRDSGVSEADIDSFKQGPEVVAKYWMQRWKDDLHAAGVSIDWRRSFITTDLTPTYSRFIQWQFQTLKKKGFVVQGTHPVVYCPHDQSPTGDHDRLTGEGEGPIEYTLVQFQLDVEGGSHGKILLPCATLRPETIYGVTNLWVNPAAQYVLADVDGQRWIVSKASILKLKDQQKKVEVIGDYDAKTLIGADAFHPLSGTRVPILPASFVSADMGTGVVMSVPAHAPYDYIALTSLQKKNDATLSAEGLDAHAVAQLKALAPIAVISLEGYGEFPAAEACKKMGINSQKEADKLEKATSEIYKHEFHKGKLNSACGPFAGQSVEACKDGVIAFLKEKRVASNLWEVTAPVVCRCTTPCHIKILENQWFLKFSDAAWKKQVHDHIRGMTILPEEARIQLDNTVDWLQNKACARKSGLGTKLPWDPAWIVETLSDSTIYMAYYTLSRIINEKHLKPENLPDEAFDYIFNGAGNESLVLQKSGLSADVLKELKAEFEYFYPVDLRSSGKDLLQNHLTFFLFHHAALFKPAHGPRGIAVNGYVTVEGEKMSKSKGNFIPLRKLLDVHGADLVRLNMVAAGEGMDDADWKEETLPAYRRQLEFLFRSAQSLPHATASTSSPASDRNARLLESRLNRCIQVCRDAMEKMNFRTAVHHGLLQSTHALRHYLQNTSQPNQSLVRNAITDITLMASPFAPHWACEVWELLGNGEFSHTARFPAFDDGKIDAKLEGEQSVLESILDDVGRILKLAKVEKPSKVTLYTAPVWKLALLKKAIASAQQEGHFNPVTVQKIAASDTSLGAPADQIASYVKTLAKAVNYYKENQLPDVDEFELLTEQKTAVEKLCGCRVEIVSSQQANAQNDPDGKHLRASPYKPAIFVA